MASDWYAKGCVFFYYCLACAFDEGGGESASLPLESRVNSLTTLYYILTVFLSFFVGFKIDYTLFMCYRGCFFYGWRLGENGIAFDVLGEVPWLK